MAEAAAARYLGTEVPSDWSLEGDRRRGHDVAGFHIRSSLKGSSFMWRSHDYTTGTWIFACTEHAPVILLIGYLTGTECPGVVTTGKYGPYIPARALHQLIDWGL